MSVLVKDLSKQYGTQLALDNVSLEIIKGEVVGLLGPNGAGKSTLMKILSCFIPPTSGTASINGFDVISDSMEVRKLVGYLPENNPLYTDMFVREYLHFIAGIHKLGKNASGRIDELIEMTGLAIEVNKKIGALSKGYRQRVGLAQALMHNPEVLILDEPTSGLDPNQLVDIRALIKSLGKEKTVILSTHIMQEVEAICDRAIIINKGRIVADDSTLNIKQKQKNNVLEVQFEEPVKADSLRQIKGVKNLREISSRHWLIEYHEKENLRKNLMQWAMNKDLNIASLQQKSLSMEEAFQELTKG
ncbi:MAG: gliding motility-associated ABC transporter ATP-binding subunit GldA [Bacteroidales bacterium]|jgi:ABC-2 type transport system ATP-binding protein|nr:gliding motility-associated ABC transporter ATP-binding subunit GldA [Bacteroidales bacterium]